MTLTVLSWLWSQQDGRAHFTAHHVNIWADMVRRHCSMDIRVACVTDMPEGIDPSVAIIAPPGEFVGLQTKRWNGPKPNCYRRLAMFRSDAAEIFGERFVAMDLDCVIGGSLDPLFDRDEDFMICGPSTTGERWRYNGSMILLRAGARARVYEEFSQAGAEEASRRFVGSDQAWISHILGAGEKIWGADDGVMRWGNRPRGASPRVMFFPGLPKPWDVARGGEDPWTATHYRRDPRGAALYLGYGARVWEDAAAEVGGDHAGVIASPEAARHWPGRIDMIARDDAQAARVGRMLGFDELVHCGASERKVG